MKILCTIPIQNQSRSRIKSLCPTAEFLFLSEGAVTKDILHDVDIILGCISPALLPYCENLRFIQLYSAGAVPYTKPGVLKPGTVLANATGAYGTSIAEHMLAATLCLLKKMHLYRSNMVLGQWRDEGTVEMIEGSNTLVLGFGDIGQSYARKMYALGSHVVGIRKHITQVPDYTEGVYTLDALSTLIEKADIVACSLPGTDETAGLLNINMLNQMKKGAILINVGRGNLIPSADLEKALLEGPLAAASIDVTEEEPLSKDSPLWKLPNLLITPHVSGNFHTNDITEKILRITEYNLNAFLSGKPIINQVDFNTGYRKFTE